MRPGGARAWTSGERSKDRAPSYLRVKASAFAKQVDDFDVEGALGRHRRPLRMLALPMFIAIFFARVPRVPPHPVVIERLGAYLLKCERLAYAVEVVVELGLQGGPLGRQRLPARGARELLG